MSLEKSIGQKVNLFGIAKDAKGGAVLLTNDGNVIFIKNLEHWSPELLNKQFYISGILKKKKFIPDPVVDKNGAISCGAFGEQLVLENVEYFKEK
jgi:hypothetical protein